MHYLIDKHQLQSNVQAQLLYLDFVNFKTYINTILEKDLNFCVKRAQSKIFDFLQNNDEIIINFNDLSYNQASAAASKSLAQSIRGYELH